MVVGVIHVETSLTLGLGRSSEKEMATHLYLVWRKSMCFQVHGVAGQT